MTKLLTEVVIDARGAAAHRERCKAAARVERHRRRTLRALALFAALAVMCAGCDWQMFGYGPAHTSFNSTESAISVGNVAGLVRRYPPSDGNGCGPETCSSPAVAQGSVYVGEPSGDLVVRDAGTGSLQWSGHTGAPIYSSPAVVDGVVYVGSDDFKLYAFDAAGNTNCSGSPKVCAPLWTANTFGKVRSSPTVANGVVYVGSDDQTLYAFSAAGNTNCGGSPKVCDPLWKTVTLIHAVGTPAIADGVVYVSAGWLFTFDAAGDLNCSGSPKICAPLWHSAPDVVVQTSPAVANGVIYVGGARTSTTDYRLWAFSATGTTNCSERPNIIDPNVLEMVCVPLWSGSVPAVKSAPAIANGVVYISGNDFNHFDPGGYSLVAFDATGVTNCYVIGSEKRCAPLWTAQQQLGTWQGSWSPAVANGVVYVTDQWFADYFYGFAGIHAFDATGTTNCSGIPKICSPLWSDVIAGPALGSQVQVSSPVVANGAVYLNADPIYKFTLP
jgi:outer membrane protein assembly factor BamB